MEYWEKKSKFSRKTMKSIYVIILISLMSVSAYAQQAVFRLKNLSEMPLFFQPQDSGKFVTIEAKDTSFVSHLSRPRYYNVVVNGKDYVPVYCAPQCSTMITVEKDGRVIMDGTFKKENEFLSEHLFNCATPENIVPYSKEWTEYNAEVLQKHLSELQNSSLDEEFKRVHASYLRNMFTFQRINGAQTSMTFSKEISQRVVLADDYYSFLPELVFDDVTMLSYPKWFDTLEKAFEEMERQGYIEVSPEKYMSVYAKRIDNATLRSHFIVGMVELAIKKGYVVDVVKQAEDLMELTEGVEQRTALAALMEKAKGIREGDVLTGSALPQFTAVTVDGKTYSLTDFRGKYVMIDFWFTGCVPCKAEMPYFDALAEEMKDMEIVFLSVSLDTGKQLMTAWRKMMEERASSPVVSVNIPGGFRSDFVKNIGLKSVPRLMLIGKDGKILDACAKRPSDPKLKALLSSLR